MLARLKQSATANSGPGRPEPAWIPAAMIGVGINMLAAGVIALSVGIAISKAIACGK